MSNKVELERCQTNLHAMPFPSYKVEIALGLRRSPAHTPQLLLIKFYCKNETPARPASDPEAANLYGEVRPVVEVVGTS